MQEFGRNSSDILEELISRTDNDLSFTDGSILGSMCGLPDPFAAEIFQKSMTINLGDPGLFPGARNIEDEVLSSLAGLLGKPDARGIMVSGGTEANIISLWAAKKAKKTSRPEVILPRSAHFSFRKAAELLDLELIWIPLDADFRMDVDAARCAISQNTVAIVGVAGSTPLGKVDDIEALAHIASERDIHLHVDAAFGGFVLPFSEAAGERVFPFDFRLPGVRTITLDPHKMGGCPIPSGCLFFRDEIIQSAVAVPVSYLAGGHTVQHSIIGTRPGASALSLWAVTQKLGRSGYIERLKKSMEITRYALKQIEKRPDLTLTVDPDINILGFSAKHVPSGILSTELRKKGFGLSDFGSHLRLVCMPGNTPEQIDALFSALDKTLKELS